MAFLIVGIPVSGGPPDLAAFGPTFLRSLHSGLPLGVAADAIRNTVYFNASDTTGHVWVLAAYAAGGLVAFGLLIAVTRRRAGSRSEANSAARVQPGVSPPSPARPLRSRARARVRHFMLRHHGLRPTGHRVKAEPAVPAGPLLSGVRGPLPARLPEEGNAMRGEAGDRRGGAPPVARRHEEAAGQDDSSQRPRPGAGEAHRQDSAHRVPDHDRAGSDGGIELLARVNGPDGNPRGQNLTEGVSRRLISLD